MATSEAAADADPAASARGTTTGSEEHRGPQAASDDVVSKRRPWTPAERELLQDWAARVRAAQHAHYYIMTKMQRRHLWIGIPVVVLTTIVGTSLFATLANSGDKVSFWLRLPVALISVLAAVLAAVQTFLGIPDQAARHGIAADWLAAVRRDIDQLLATPEEEVDRLHETMSDVRKEINKISQNAPPIGEDVWHSFATRFGAREPLDAPGTL